MGSAGAEAPRVGAAQSGLARSVHRGLPGATQPSSQSILELSPASKGAPTPVRGGSLTPAPGSQQSASCLYGFPYLGPSVQMESLQSVPLGAWVLSPSITLSRPIHVVAGVGPLEKLFLSSFGRAGF